MEKIIFRHRKPSHVPNEFESTLLFKFFRTENFMRDFIGGKLYISNIESLIGHSSENLTNGQRDEYEGTDLNISKKDNYHPVLCRDENNGFVIRIKDEGDIDENYDTRIEYLSRGFDVNKYKNVLCFYAVWLNLKKSEALNTPDNKMVGEFGEFCILLENPNEFFRRIFIAYTDRKLEFNSNPEIGYVDYIDITSSPVNELGVFKKRHTYNYQSEMRFVLDIKDNTESLHYFEIGDISDIVSVVEVQDLLKGIRLDKKLVK